MGGQTNGQPTGRQMNGTRNNNLDGWMDRLPDKETNENLWEKEDRMTNHIFQTVEEPCMQVYDLRT